MLWSLLRGFIFYILVGGPQQGTEGDPTFGKFMRWMNGQFNLQR